MSLHMFWARFLSLAWSKLRLCSVNHRPGYWSNLPCDWPRTVWAYSERETKNEPWCTSNQRHRVWQIDHFLITIKLDKVWAVLYHMYWYIMRYTVYKAKRNELFKGGATITLLQTVTDHISSKYVRVCGCKTMIKSLNEYIWNYCKYGAIFKISPTVLVKCIM